MSLDCPACKQPTTKLNCPRCRTPLDDKHLAALENAKKVKDACGAHVRRIELRDYYCPDCFETIGKEVKK